MDQYLNQKNCNERLIREWEEYKKIVIAVDFDNTVYDCHGKGHSYDNVLKLLILCKVIGCYIIVFTANDNPERHDFIRTYFSDNCIEIDSINENVESVPFKTKKPYWNILLDDRAGLPSAYATLDNAVNHMIIRNHYDIYKN